MERNYHRLNLNVRDLMSAEPMAPEAANAGQEAPTMADMRAEMEIMKA